MICVQNFARLLITPRFWLAMLIVYSIAVGLTAININGDFNVFYGAALAFRAGINPYTVTGYYSPLYVALAFVPATWFPLPVAYHLYASFVIFAYGLAFYVLTQRRIRMTILLMLSAFPLLSAYYGNLEPWILLGAVLPPVVGIWFVLAKPQMGLIVAALFLLQRWDKSHSIGDVAKLAIPVGAAFAVSFLAGMFEHTPIAASWNMSIWPAGILLGVPAVIVALNYRLTDMALLAGPFISPYLGGPASFAGVLPALVRRWWLAALGVVASWVLVVVWRARL